MIEINRAIHKLDFMRSAYQKLIDEKVNEGIFVGTDVTGTWKADTPLDDAYREHIEAITLGISALEKQETERWIPVTEKLPEEDCECRVTEDNEYSKYVIDCNWSNRKKQFEVWSDYNDCYIQLVNVTAWKLKEEPYTEEEA